MNQLTLTPYYACIVYLLFMASQSIFINYNYDPVGFENLLFRYIQLFGGLTGAIALSIQLFEWHLLTILVKFQSNCMFDQLHIQRGVYKQLENKALRKFKSICFVVLLLQSVSLIGLYALMIYRGVEDQIYIDLLVYRLFRLQDFAVYYGLLVAIITITVQLRQALKAYQYIQYTEHKQRIFAQSFGMFMFCFLNLSSEMLFVNRMFHLTLQQYEDSSLDDSINYILFLGPQLCACLIYVLFKIPEDCFHCFNRVPSITYSKFQYQLTKKGVLATPLPQNPNYEETEGTPTSSQQRRMVEQYGLDM